MLWVFTVNSSYSSLKLKIKTCFIIYQLLPFYRPLCHQSFHRLPSREPLNLQFLLNHLTVTVTQVDIFMPPLSALRSYVDPPDYFVVSDLPDPPSIHLQSKFLPNQTEVVLPAGSPFTLSCTGATSVRWSTSAFRLLYHVRLEDPLIISRSDPRHTGTYRCGYTNQSFEHLSTWIHLYVTGNMTWSHSLNLQVRITWQKFEASFILFFRCLSHRSSRHLYCVCHPSRQPLRTWRPGCLIQVSADWPISQ